MTNDHCIHQCGSDNVIIIHGVIMDGIEFSFVVNRIVAAVSSAVGQMAEKRLEFQALSPN